MTFRDYGAAIGTVTLARGLASITIQPAAGYHSYSATYNGNVYTDPVSSAVNDDYTVDAAPLRAGGKLLAPARGPLSSTRRENRL